ncbi:MAG TPA: hypothetical protein VK654_00985, partial [Nitrospirota bacterium]|nr:hypothetical protein [Nitrospirota bacterium]
MKNGLNVRCVMSKDALLRTENDQAVYAMVEITSGGRTGFGAAGANFALVLDRSGSMDGEKMDNLKEAVGYVVDHLSD